MKQKEFEIFLPKSIWEIRPLLIICDIRICWVMNLILTGNNTINYRTQSAHCWPLWSFFILYKKYHCLCLFWGGHKQMAAAHFKNWSNRIQLLWPKYNFLTCSVSHTHWAKETPTSEVLTGTMKCRLARDRWMTQKGKDFRPLKGSPFTGY